MYTIYLVTIECLNVIISLYILLEVRKKMSRVENVYNYYKSNSENDPNIYELIEVLCDSSHNEDGKASLVDLVKLEVDRLFKNGIVTDEKDPLVQLVQEVQSQVLSGAEISDEFADYAKKVAGISFYIKQQQRGMENPDDFTYDNVGEKKSDSLRKLSDLIAKSFKAIKTPIKYRLSNFAKGVQGFEARRDLVIQDVLPYIYPQESQDFAKSVSSPFGPGVDLIVRSIIDLDIGVDFDIVKKRLEEDTDGSGLGFAKSVIVLYSKVGPDFAESLGGKMDDDKINYLNALRQKNKKYANELASKTSNSELESMIQESEGEFGDNLEGPVIK